MAKKTSFTFKLTKDQQETLLGILSTGNYLPTKVPHTVVSVKTPGYGVNLYTSGKCLVQGKEAEDFVMFILEPMVLLGVGVGYEETLNPEAHQPHMGIDESGKGDFFGPLVIAGAFIDESVIPALKDMGVKDSKQISSDKKALQMGRELRKVLQGKFSLVRIGPSAYNRLYAKMRNVNTLLAWGHARAIENVMDLVPGCTRALSDQFGRKDQVERALMSKGRKIKLEQRPRAEEDLAVAAASIIAREAFLFSLKRLGDQYKVEMKKGASAAVSALAGELVKKHGPMVLTEIAKCHFRTTDKVLATQGHSRKDLGAVGSPQSKAAREKK
jgi:ribonuclease HIII